MKSHASSFAARVIPLSIALSLTVFAASNAMASTYSQDGLPHRVKVPDGHRVAIQTVGVGEITYECRVKKDVADQFEWTFVGRDAALNDRSGMKIGRY